MKEYIGLKHALIFKLEKDSGRTKKEADFQYFINLMYTFKTCTSIS